ncbi:MAG: nucleoside diphosphate kinase regulator [Candidatus Omnitrophica bacterium]|nr:nucleoside diphosphate kinase regulator [Candidatus Omnitrophota bacterium]
MNKKIYITTDNFRKLQETIDSLRLLADVLEKESLDKLEAELRRATIIDQDKTPDDVVTMNSTVCLMDIESGKEETYKLVYPSDADIEENKISVLAPIGTAIIGYKAGDVVEWRVPAGARKILIKEIIHQPENGDPSGF